MMGLPLPVAAFTWVRSGQDDAGMTLASPGPLAELKNASPTGHGPGGLMPRQPIMGP